MLSSLLSSIKLAPAHEVYVCLVAVRNAYGMSSHHKLVPALNFLTWALAFSPAKQPCLILCLTLYAPKIPFKTHNRDLPDFRPRPPQTRAAPFKRLYLK